MVSGFAYPMIRTFLPLLVFCRVALAYEPPDPTREVEVLRFEWKDSARSREVPVKIYLPKDITKPSPVIIFSHGLGGSREGYEYVGRHWAGCGFVSVHVQHQGSDDSVWKKAEPNRRMNSLRDATLNPSNTIDRPRDISFVIDQLERAPFRERLDLGHIGAAGHSYGGFTVMAIAGQALGPRRSRELADPRVKAVIQMSAPVPRGDRDADAAYARITMPVFHMTGTKDDSPIGDTKPEQRRIPYDHMTAAETCLLIFKDGDHMVFSGVTRPGDKEFHRHICASSTAWWDAHLRGNADARKWLMEGGFKEVLGDGGTFEVRQVKSP